MALIKNRRRGSRRAWTPVPSRVTAQPNLIQTYAETPPNPAAYAGLYLLPCLLGAVGLIVYLFTLNRWVSPDSLGTVASLTGMIWGPEHLEPATFLITLPLRWLPASLIPAALNLLTATCAALSLALLARSVSLLPHKIYKRNFKQCLNHPKPLSSRYAWLPPLLAVTVCGLQYSFWANATDATGEMVNLLLFAYMFRCLPEYSVSRNNSWLLKGAFAYGLALANNAYMAAFFPAILISLFWVKRLHIFDVAFLSRLLRQPKSFNLRLLVLIPICWFAGLAVFFLKPMLSITLNTTQTHLVAALKAAVRAYLTAFPDSFQFWWVCCLVTLMPAAYLMLRYYHSLTALKRLNLLLPRFFFHLIYGFFWLIFLWIMLDSQLSPRWLGLGQADLPLYYLAALSAGYFTGHFLRVAEASKTHPKRHARLRAHSTRTQDPYVFLKRGLVVFTGAVSLTVITLMVCKNLPVILQMRNNPLNQFFTEVGRTLPAHGGVVICNDPFLQDYAEAAVIRQGLQSKFLFLNADAAMENGGYFEYLKHKNPEFTTALTAVGPLNPTNRQDGFIKLLQNLSQSRDIFCLQPSPAFEFLAQYFYPQPDGLLYHLTPYRDSTPTLQPRVPNPDTASETFWQSFENQQSAGLIGQINGPPTSLSPGPWDQMMNFHPELSRLMTLAGNYYATALNNRGVELQQRGRFAEAGKCFDQASQLDPHNSAVQINRQFNQDYQAGKKTAVRTSQEEDITLSEYRDWKHVERNGLVDEPNFCNLMGQILANAGLYRPAIVQFERAKKFTPDGVRASQNLAVTYFDGNDFTDAIAEANQVIASEPTNATALFIKGISSVQLEAYIQAIPPLTSVLAVQPKNGLARLNRAICYLKTGMVEAARRDYELVTQSNPELYSAYYNLAELAYRNQDTVNSIKYYELYLQHAPSNQPQIALAETRLKVLKTMIR